MARFYFVVRAPDHRHDDPFGTHLANHNAAGDYAHRIVRELREGGYAPGTVLIVQDEERRTIQSIPL